jgi:DNA-binding MarR family transcriptional regulator
MPDFARSISSADAEHPLARRRLPLLLRRAWYGLNQAFRRRIARMGVTPDQFTVLRTLSESDPRGITQSELTQAMSSDPNTVASLLERMQRAGWVDRQPHERDRRAHRILLRPRGAAKFAEAQDEALSLQADVLNVIPKAEREEFLDQLDRVASACRKEADRQVKRGRCS